MVQVLQLEPADRGVPARGGGRVQRGSDVGRLEREQVLPQEGRDDDETYRLCTLTQIINMFFITIF